MPWPVNPDTIPAFTYVPFVQADWMVEYSDLVGNTPLTKSGVCMALTTQLFMFHKRGGDPESYFKWIKSRSGAITMMGLQTDYGKDATGTTDGTAQPNVSAGSLLDSFRRVAENKLYKEAGFIEIDSPVIPSILGYWSTLPRQVVEQKGNGGCIYKPIYMASLTGGGAHTVGAILGYDNSSYMFFDANHGFAEFRQLTQLQSFVDLIQDEYSDSYSSYFIDTKCLSENNLNSLSYL